MSVVADSFRQWLTANKPHHTLSSNQFDLFPTSEPEIKGQLAAFAFVLRGLIETLIANGSLTKEEVITLLHHADLKSVFAVLRRIERPDAGR